ncbi:hypothetical protein TUN199_08647 [Pyrenophora tritici-repentis]|uniref:DUF6604 domain-containing protein n=2 Tax=Pyrenophora tritici-repentis TaxID=45151 RepID=A0A2W1GRE1_9PLEO|nr:hypothetical protein Alg215_09196 [Pyrenophora tritici-repentis]KAI0576757.1 hypothetical protein Alg130_08654 [Pyrenophora tritici-repentis]KAI0607194.1 hypothetical protein TUN205_08553 [Pyrenophora tritici-repentis]KAI0619367.1 hypothetical protein TUN199_08647 [Pyrenophora tritici-repentis]KAI1516294.1 hypothetical protein Ptr86124_004831 [Pyrenophora tritici-repentis]
MAPLTSVVDDDRLPPSLFQIYRAYKQSTAVVLDWLQPQTDGCLGSVDDAAHPKVSIHGILVAAQKAAASARRPPAPVHDASKVALVHRKKLTEYYEGLPTKSEESKESTERHKAFNNTLADAYALLFPKRQQSAKCPKKTKSTEKIQPTTTPLSSNSFELLSHFIEHEPDYGASVSHFWANIRAKAPKKRSSVSEDPIDTTIATEAYVLELKRLSPSLESYGQLLRAVKYLWLLVVSRSTGCTKEPTLLPGVYIPRKHGVEYGRYGCDERLNDFIEDWGFLAGYHEISKFRKTLRKDGFIIAKPERERLEDYFETTPPATESKPKTHCSPALPTGLPSSFEFTFTLSKDHQVPDIPDVHHQKKPETDPQSSYIYDNLLAQSILCSVYRVVEQAAITFKTDPLTVKSFLISRAMNGIGNLIKQMSGFRDGTEFSLHNQSPWINGGHMASILGRGTFVGIELLNDRGHFALVLHVYNMLKQTALMRQKLPILEELETHFGSAVFTSLTNRPRKDYLATYDRYRGYKLKRRRTIFDDTDYLHREPPKMYKELPFSRDGRIKAANLSTFALEGAMNKYRINLLLGKLADEDQGPKFKHYDFDHPSRCRAFFADHSLTDLTERAKDCIMREFQGPLPLAKINYFAVMTLCMEIWEQVCRRATLAGHSDTPKQTEFDFLWNKMPKRVEDAEAMCGMWIGISALNVAEYGKDNRNRARPLDSYSLPIMVRDAMVEVCEGKELSDFLWKSDC